MVHLKDKKILLASCDERIADIILILLKSWGYDVAIVVDKGNIIGEVSRIQPDLVIVDCDLPKFNGLEVIKKLKTDYHSAHIPVLMMLEKKNVRRDILEIEQGLDDYLIRPPDPIDLEVRIEMALRRTEHQFSANPLSKLPGSRMLEKLVRQKLQSGDVFSFLYCDINNFKSFNDKYGYKCGDGVIMQAAHIITCAIKQYGADKDFVFHIGGDDFVALTEPSRETAVARFIIDEFDKLMPFHYSPLDRERGFIRIKDRLGKISDFSLMGISISIVNNLHRNITNLIEFIEIAFEIKRYLKRHKHSRSLVNRRKASPPPLLEKTAESPKWRINYNQKRKQEISKPLGQVLLERKLIDSGQLQAALFKHWDSSMHLGEVLLDMNVIGRQQLEKALEESKLGQIKLDIPKE